MSLMRLARRGYRGGGSSEPRIVGGSGFANNYGLTQLLSGSSFDYYREAGPIYDNSVAQLCINLLWRKLPELSWCWEKSTDAETWVRDKGPKGGEYVLNALRNPNDAYDGSVLLQASSLSHCCRGNGFWLVRRDRMRYPMGFWWVYNSQVRALSNRDNAAGTKLITHYEYTPVGGVPGDKDIEDVIHFRWGLDPLNQAYGLSPWLGQLREICTDNESGTHMAALLRNGAVPGLILVPQEKIEGGEDGMPTRSQRSKIKEWFRSFTRDRKGEVEVTPWNVKIEKPGFSPEEMVLDKVRSIPAGRICGAVGQDPMVHGIDTQRQTFNNYEQALKSAILNSLMPIAWMFAEQGSWQILPQFEIDPNQYRLAWNTDRVIGIQEDVDALHTRWRENYKAGMVDRFTAKTRIGEEAGEEDKGVYASAGQDQDDEDEQEQRQTSAKPRS